MRSRIRYAQNRWVSRGNRMSHNTVVACAKTVPYHRLDGAPSLAGGITCANSVPYLRVSADTGNPVTVDFMALKNVLTVPYK